MTKEECEIETSKAIMEMRSYSEKLEKKNAELKEKLEVSEIGRKRDICVMFELQDENKQLLEQLTEAKEIIREYMLVVKGDNTTVCSVPEEKRCIDVLKLNERAEQFCKEK